MTSNNFDSNASLVIFGNTDQFSRICATFIRLWVFSSTVVSTIQNIIYFPVQNWNLDFKNIASNRNNGVLKSIS